MSLQVGLHILLLFKINVSIKSYSEALIRILVVGFILISYTSTPKTAYGAAALEGPLYAL